MFVLYLKNDFKHFKNSTNDKYILNDITQILKKQTCMTKLTTLNKYEINFYKNKYFHKTEVEIFDYNNLYEFKTIYEINENLQKYGECLIFSLLSISPSEFRIFVIFPKNKLNLTIVHNSVANLEKFQDFLKLLIVWNNNYDLNSAKLLLSNIIKS